MKHVFTRAEVWALVLQERMACAAICSDEERTLAQAGDYHRDSTLDEAARDRCYAGARAAASCRKAIATERPWELLA